tara:strand:+ start:652 stop:1311 length:660 start_codon:yes stop_codon:yes gene_type:complete
MQLRSVHRLPAPQQTKRKLDDPGHLPNKRQRPNPVYSPLLRQFDLNAGSDWQEDFGSPVARNPVFVYNRGILHDKKTLSKPTDLVVAMSDIIRRLFEAANREGTPRPCQAMYLQARDMLTPDPRGPLLVGHLCGVMQLVPQLMRHLYNVGMVLDASTALRAMYGCFLFAVKFEIDYCDLTPDLLAFCIGRPSISATSIIAIECCVCSYLWRRKMPFLFK